MIHPFGTLEDGRRVDAVTLGAPDALQVEVLTYGAILRRISYPVRGRRRDLILYFASLEEYVRDRAYVGPMVGRFGNRIAGARFTIDGRQHRVTANEGVNHLHGGALGFGKRLWNIDEARGASLVLTYRSPAGEEGYPASMDVTASFTVAEDALTILLSAGSDAPTPVNLTYHPYFNLAADKAGSAIAHWLRIPAAHYLPVRDGLIPTGEVAPVSGTAFDFRSPRVLAPPGLDSEAQLALAGGYDHCWVLSKDADCSCELSSPDRDLTMHVRGSGPGLQFYNGQFLARTYPALGSGLILEPQGFPNAPNEPRFPPAVVRPGELYRAEIEYRFREAA
ncbi:MAG TPA: aldose epimerase family protein [Steroidobacteraceae bacterium]